MVLLIATIIHPRNLEFRQEPDPHADKILRDYSSSGMVYEFNKSGFR
jgi:hypothetical protein